MHFVKAPGKRGQSWDWDGNLFLKEDMCDIIMVAGKDPYAEKGIENLTMPVLRDKRKNVK